SGDRPHHDLWIDAYAARRAHPGRRAGLCRRLAQQPRQLRRRARLRRLTPHLPVVAILRYYPAGLRQGRTMSIKDALCEAIGQRRTVSFIYKSGARTVEPYILGYDDRGALTLSAYQTRGGSGAGFRTFLVDGMSLVTITDHEFSGVRPEYNPRDRYFPH